MVESVRYQVERSEGRFEIRRYPSMVLAKVTGRSDNEAFGLLLGYISGENRSTKKIPMTAPVVSSERIEMTAPVVSDIRSFSFVLPEGYDADSAPAPLDPGIKIEGLPDRRVAVIRFRGYAGKRAVAERTSELLERVRRLGLRVEGEQFLMRYNPPITPGFLRRNEVAVEVRGPDQR